MGDNREPKPTKPPHDTTAAQMAPPEPSEAPKLMPAELLTMLPSVLDVGEQVFGSSHVFEIAAPWNLDLHDATVSATVGDNEAFIVESFPKVLHASTGRMRSNELEDQLTSSIKIRFSPVASSEYPNRYFATEVAIVVSWQDGRVERRTVQLRGRARRLEDRPERPHDDGAANTGVTRAATPSEAGGPYNEANRTQLDHSFELAKSKAAAIARSQHDAIDTVHDEAGSYVPPPMKHSLWWDLAENAIMMGTGMVAGVIGKWLAENVVVGVAGKANKTVIDGLAGAMKDGMKAGAKGAIQAISGGGAYDMSSDKKIAFFEMQKDALNKLVTNNEELVIDRWAELTPLLASQPQVAIHAMQTVADALAAHNTQANLAQKASTSAGWVAFRARTSLGAETVPSRERETVTDLSRARPAHPGPTLASVKGLLDLNVDIEHGAPYVASARVDGVARSLANELMNKTLGDLGIPLRIVVGRDEPEPTIITRDEVGRIRVTGNLQRLSRFANDGLLRDEAQAELAARTLVETVLSRPLVPKAGSIEGDDHQKET